MTGSFLLEPINMTIRLAWFAGNDFIAALVS